MRRLLLIVLVLAAGTAALVAAGNVDLGPLLITREGEQKVVLLFGTPTAVRTKPGVWWRIPLLTEVLTFDSRYRYLNTEPSKIQTRDQERIVVDNYVMWRVTDPLQFYASFPQGMHQAQSRIDGVVRADVRDVIGQHTIPEVLTESRVEIMQKITKQAREELESNGITIEEVRINRTELPGATLKNVFARMRTERGRLARKYRAEGAEEGTRIRAAADRQARVIVAEARRDADILRGEGDAQAAAIYAKAYGADPDFYAFVRSLEAYRKTLSQRTTMILPPEHEFFRALQSPDAGR